MVKKPTKGKGAMKSTLGRNSVVNETGLGQRKGGNPNYAADNKKLRLASRTRKKK